MHRHLDTVRAFIGDEQLLEPRARVLVGLSGGVDSMVLADMLLALKYQVSALHVNYRLRGEASEDDERFVRSRCAQLDIRLHVDAFDTAVLSETRGTSIQETARDLRYEAYGRVARDWGVDVVAVGHQRDDHAETVLMHLLRGSGPEGLAGMPVRRALRTGSDVRLIRPLLCLRRRDIEAYAVDRGLSWREDASNLKAEYRRGALRSTILPLIEQHFGPSALENVARSADLMRAYVESGLEDDIRSAWSAAFRAEMTDNVHGGLDLEALRSLEPVLRGRVILEAIRRWIPALGAGEATVRQVAGLLEAQPGRRLAHPSGVVWRERERLLFMPPKEDDESARCDAELWESGRVNVPEGVVDLDLDAALPDSVPSGSGCGEFVDADRLEMPFVIRPWRPGDRFTPLGMDHSKKISDFLTDEKVPPHRREHVRVAVAGGEIVWVVGHRISEIVRIRPETRRVARLRFERRA